MVDVLGAKLGRYEVRERLGKGGMAAVYKGWDANLDRWVAIKVLHDHLVEEAGFKERFEREAKVVASLSHPNIVQVYDFDSTQVSGVPVYYIVMTYVPGKSLKNLMDETNARGERLALNQIANILRGVSGALSYAHSQGIVHRDVTPGNILFDSQGQAVLSDFGIARIISTERLTQSGMTTGTPVYMPPEQAVGKGGDRRSDIYSLGVILFEMLTGQAPYSGDSAVAVIMQHLNEPVPSLRERNSELTPSMENVVFRAMAKDPEDRYQDAKELYEDFERAVLGERVTSIQGPSRTIALPAVAPNQALPWKPIAAGAALILIVLLGAILLRGGPTNLSGGADPLVTLANAPTAKGPTKAANAPAMTGGPLIFTDEFGPDRKSRIWQITTDGDVYRNIENNAYHIRTTLSATAVTAVFDEEHQYGAGFQYDADLTISDKSQPDTGTGIIFRYQNDDAYYVFAINGQGQISIWLRYGDTWTELRNLGPGVAWTPTDGAKPAGQTNHLKLVDRGNRLIGYVNDKPAVDISTQPVIMSGAIGIYVATTQSKKIPNPLADVLVNNFSAAYFPSQQATAPDATQSTAAATTAATAAP